MTGDRGRGAARRETGDGDEEEVEVKVEVEGEVEDVRRPGNGDLGPGKDMVMRASGS